MRNISFDIAAIIVLILLLSSVAFRKATTGRTNKILLASIFTCLVSSTFDVLANLFDVYWTNFVGIVTVTHLIYLICHSSQSVIYLFFVISLLDLWHKLDSKKVLKVALIAPYAIVFGLTVSSPFTGLIFSTENGLYKHGPLFYSLYGCVALYILLVGIIVLINRKLLTRTKVVGLFSMAFMCLTAAILHILMPTEMLECFAVALSLFIVSIVIQRPEELLDSDTGLYKHSAYGHDAKNSFKNGKHWHVVMLNIANYSSINSMLGYEQSVEVLKIIAGKLRVLNKNLGNKGKLYYLDRGRFRIVFDERERTIAETFATLINNELKMKIRLNGFDINLSPMIVITRCPEEIDNFKSLMAFGQDFHEKNPYTGRVIQAPEIYHPDKFEVQNNINKIIEKALENRSFQVYYQPIYSVEKGRFVSAEALLRLFDDEHGFISPELIVTSAEKSGAIHKIGEYVFEEVCKFVSSDEFKALGLDYIEVNLSVAQCMHGDLADKILTIMQQYNVSPRSINLEITETAASYSQRVMTDNLNKLSRAGIEFSLDDFGTGYSNMKRVVSLPLKIVKLDKSFVDEKENPKMWIFLQNTIKMLKDMNMEIVVEGIETKEMLDAFSDLKCDFIQGYYFSKAISKNDFVKFITDAQQKQAQIAE